MGQDQTRPNIEPDLDPNCLTVVGKFIFWESADDNYSETIEDIRDQDQALLNIDACLVSNF